MSLLIQDPNMPASISLHELLLNACEDAVVGGGVFAFVTTSGIKLLLEDVLFQEFLARGKFYLVVGVDEITNIRALDRLSSLISKCENLVIRVFYNDNTQARTFHPKFCWFADQNAGNIIIGSGNLTQKGLRRNWEVFSQQTMGINDFQDIQSAWNQWLEFNEENLRTLDDPEVIDQASRNIRTYTISPRVETETEEDIFQEEENIIISQDEVMHPDEDLAAWKFIDDDISLIAEIPRASDRWNQANFNKSSFENFFGATPGNNNHRVLFRHINPDLSFGELEVRPSVSVRSRNFRFELDAASGLDYPDNGRPIAVFIRVSQRMFLYTLSMPGSLYHDLLEGYLDSIRGDTLNLLRVQISVRELKEIAANLPFWRLTF